MLSYNDVCTIPFYKRDEQKSVFNKNNKLTEYYPCWTPDPDAFKRVYTYARIYVLKCIEMYSLTFLK